MKYFYLFIFLITTTLSSAQEDLNRTWFLTELTINGENITIPNEESQTGFPTLSILINDAEGMIEGSAICNGFSSDDSLGPVTATETEITFNISHTLAVCDTSDEINFESAYFNFLGTPESQEFSYSVNNDLLEFTQLTLTKDNGDVALFSPINENPPSSLTQEGWYLDFFEIDGVAQNPPPAQQGQENDFIISSFAQETILDQGYRCFAGGSGAFSAFNFFGINTISVDFLAQLTLDCSIPILNEYDQAFTIQLEGKTHTYEIIEAGQGRELILTDQNGDRIFYTNAFLNTEDFNQVTDVNLSPNPAQDFLTITGDTIDRISNYQIVDLQGKILRQDSFANTISVNTLSQGLYFLVLNAGEQRLVKRFIKN